MTNKTETKKQANGGYYARRPIEEIKAFKSKDGKSFVVQVIKTCVFPINYAHTIIKNQSPYSNGATAEEAGGSEQ
ncbi:MAG: hypothetical protein HON90_07865 [Halobacteriovoraceae bacterium]|jgi:hypothetical protein|nr:hypothetical protein [Halobacteriovoraceae bacterium]